MVDCTIDSVVDSSKYYILKKAHSFTTINLQSPSHCFRFVSDPSEYRNLRLLTENDDDDDDTDDDNEERKKS